LAGSSLGFEHSAETIEKIHLKAIGRKHTVETLALLCFALLCFALLCFA
jgi:hypothetical protein